jgi:hypothetical protein
MRSSSLHKFVPALAGPSSYLELVLREQMDEALKALADCDANLACIAPSRAVRAAWEHMAIAHLSHLRSLDWLRDAAGLRPDVRVLQRLNQPERYP